MMVTQIKFPNKKNPGSPGVFEVYKPREGAFEGFPGLGTNPSELGFR